MGPPSARPLDHRVAELAARQDGLVRRRDLADLGVTRGALRHRLDAGLWHPVHPGVWAVGHPGISRRAQFLAATFWAGGDPALSWDSAAAFYGWIQEDPAAWPPVHVSVPPGNGARSRPGVVVHRTARLTHHDVVPYGLLRVTDRVRTLVDLADGRDYDALRAIADELPALPKDALAAKAAGLPGRTGAGRTLRLIRSEDGEARFALERRSVAYFRRHGVPEPDGGRNVRVHGLRVDCWYRDARLVVELDSRAHHTRRKELEADRLRDRRLKRHGIDTMRLVWRDLELGNPLAAQDLLQQLAARRGA